MGKSCLGGRITRARLAGIGTFGGPGMAYNPINVGAFFWAAIGWWRSHRHSSWGLCSYLFFTSIPYLFTLLLLPTNAATLLVKGI